MSAWSGQQGGTWWEPPRPVAVPRRPLGNLLRTAFRVYARSFVPFLALSALVCGLAAIVVAPAELALADIVGRVFAATPLQPGSGDQAGYQAIVTQLVPQETVLGLVVTVGTGLMNLLALAVVVAGTPEAALGQPVRIGVALRRFVAHLVPLLALSALLIGLQAVGGILSTLVQLSDPSTISSSADVAQVSSAAVIVLVIGLAGVVLDGVVLYLYVRWFVILPLVIVDGLGVRAAMRRSSELTRGSRWYITGALVSLVLIQAVLTIIVEVAAVAIGLVFGAGSIDASLSLSDSAALGTLVAHVTAYTSIVGLLLVAIFYPVIAIAMAILRSDFTWRAQTLASLTAPGASATSAAQGSPTPPVGA